MQSQERRIGIGEIDQRSIIRELGSESWDRSVRIKRRVRIGGLVSGCLDRQVGIGELGSESQDRRVRIAESGMGGWDRRVRI